MWPGGSRILVEISAGAEDAESAGAAFYVERDGNPRISSVEFENFCIDGLHFVDDGFGKADPENTYINGKQVSILQARRILSRLTGWDLYIWSME